MSRRPASWFARRTFNFWQRLGLHVVPNHYYGPVPDTREFAGEFWNSRNKITGVNLNEEAQSVLINELSTYRQEFDSLAAQGGTNGAYRLDNQSFGPVDAAAYYAIARQAKPKKVIEIGGGYSSWIASAALKRSSQEGNVGSLTVIEPYPTDKLRSTLSTGGGQLIEKKVQQCAPALFDQLTAGDILFIDSSHVLKTGSDVVFEFTEILPRLAKGVSVHFHDIFLPNEYPRDWVVKRKRFWNEQYVLQSVLANSDRYRVVLALSYLHSKKGSALNKLTKHYQTDQAPGSFWIEVA